MIYLYETFWDAFRTHRSWLYSINARPSSTNPQFWTFSYILTPELAKEFADRGIAIDDPMSTITAEFQSQLDAVFASPFWNYGSTNTEEYDLRSEGTILLVSDRAGYGFSFSQITPGSDHPVHTDLASRYGRVSTDYIRTYVLKTPIKKIVMYHDFWDRTPDFDPESAITDPSPNLFKDEPSAHPRPARPVPSTPTSPAAVVSTTVSVPSGASTMAATTVLSALPPIGTKVRIDLLNQTENDHYWESATYRNKEQLKRWGAKFDGMDKVWYLTQVPTAEIQTAITAMGINFLVRA